MRSFLDGAEISGSGEPGPQKKVAPERARAWPKRTHTRAGLAQRGFIQNSHQVWEGHVCSPRGTQRSSQNSAVPSKGGEERCVAAGWQGTGATHVWGPGGKGRLPSAERHTVP